MAGPFGVILLFEPSHEDMVLQHVLAAKTKIIVVPFLAFILVVHRGLTFVSALITVLRSLRIIAVVIGF